MGNPFTRLFFNWGYPFVKVNNDVVIITQEAKEKGLTLEQLGELPEEDKIDVIQKRIRKSWSLYKDQKSDYALFKSILHANRCMFLLAY